MAIITTVTIVPSHSKTVTVGNDRRIILLTRDIRIDEKFLANHLAIHIEALSPNVVARTGIMAAVITPGDDKPTVVQRCHRGLILMARGVGVDPELITDQRTRLIEQLSSDVVVRTAAMAAAVRPGHHILTVGKTCH